MLVAAFIAGVLGSGWHLWWTRRRALLLPSGSQGLLLVLLPVGLAGPVLAAAAVIWAQPDASWAFFVGLVASRMILLPRLGSEAAWMA